MAGYDYDLLIVGSGFGGSVAALRAAEKGYRAGVMEGFGESARAPEVQAAIGAAIKRGLQTRDWELDMGRASDNP